MIKKILIGAGLVLISAGIVFGVLFFIKQRQPDTATDTPATVLDFSKDYGACSLLDTASIESALGSAADDLQAAENTGIVGEKLIGEGVEDIVADSQLCVYAFKPGGTLENGFNAGDGFTIQRTTYTNETGPTGLIEQTRADELTTEIEALGDVAFYNANTVSQGPGGTYSFTLQVFKGSESTSFIIRQPAEEATFTSETAQTALMSLAQTAQL